MTSCKSIIVGMEPDLSERVIGEALRRTEYRYGGSSQASVRYPLGPSTERHQPPGFADTVRLEHY